MLISFVVPKFVNLSRNSAIVGLSFNLIKELIESLSIEILLQFLVKYVHLISEILIAITSVIDIIHKPLTSFEITWFSTSMKFILKFMFDIVLKIFWNIISMSDIPNSSHWNCTHELVSKTRKLNLKKPNNM
jgi:hypothetical protein